MQQPGSPHLKWWLTGRWLSQFNCSTAQSDEANISAICKTPVYDQFPGTPQGYVRPCPWKAEQKVRRDAKPIRIRNVPWQASRWKRCGTIFVQPTGQNSHSLGWLSYKFLSHWVVPCVIADKLSSSGTWVVTKIGKKEQTLKWVYQTQTKPHKTTMGLVGYAYVSVM